MTEPTVLRLADEIHLWRIDLSRETAQLQPLFSTLSTDEQERAARFYFPKDREQFVAARGSLRRILSCYLNIAPADLYFCYGPQGKPALVPEQGGRRLQFNLSHSQGLALIAIARDRPLGVDLEAVDPNYGWQDIARQFFTPKEQELLHQLPAPAQGPAFFQLWTRKEALLKAIGMGLSVPLNQVEVGLDPDKSIRSVRPPWRAQSAEAWIIQDLPLAPTYAAAVAIADLPHPCLIPLPDVAHIHAQILLPLPGSAPAPRNSPALGAGSGSLDRHLSPPGHTSHSN